MARHYLVSKGYSILDVNWRFAKYELDIVAQTGETIVFVEVKTRKNNIFAEPEISVTRKKQGFLIAAANQYLLQKDIDLEARFDIIAIQSNNNKQSVNHLEGAFYPLAK